MQPREIVSTYVTLLYNCCNTPAPFHVFPSGGLGHYTAALQKHANRVLEANTGVCHKTKSEPAIANLISLSDDDDEGEPPAAGPSGVHGRVHHAAHAGPCMELTSSDGHF